MSPGYIAVQSIHALAEFQNEHSEIYQNWYNFSKGITLLALPNEDNLKYLIRRLTEQKIRFSIFNEPDIDNQITSIAIEPSQDAKRLCSNIPLALKEYNNAGLINKHHLNGKEVVS